MQGSELSNVHRNLIPSLQSCVIKSLFIMLWFILWNLKILTKPSIIVRVMRYPLKLFQGFSGYNLFMILYLAAKKLLQVFIL